MEERIVIQGEKILLNGREFNINDKNIVDKLVALEIIECFETDFLTMFLSEVPKYSSLIIKNVENIVMLQLSIAKRIYWQSIMIQVN